MRIPPKRYLSPPTIGVLRRRARWIPEFRTPYPISTFTWHRTIARPLDAPSQAGQCQLAYRFTGRQNTQVLVGPSLAQTWQTVSLPDASRELMIKDEVGCASTTDQLDHVLPLHAGSDVRVGPNSQTVRQRPASPLDSSAWKMPRPYLGSAKPKPNGSQNKTCRNQSQVCGQPLAFPKCVRFVITAVLQAGAFQLT
jgi:hypothetical protein